MENHGTATIGQFAELAAIFLRALSKALVGLDIKELIKALGINGEKLSSALHSLLASFTSDKEKQVAEEEIVTFPQYRKFSAGGRNYEVIPAAKRHENYIPGNDLIKRAEAKTANLGKEEANHILSHQNEISLALRKISIIFTNWRSEDNQNVAYLAWNGKEWGVRWRPINQDWQQAYSWWLIQRIN